jgi:hypothetical protein
MPIKLSDIGYCNKYAIHFSIVYDYINTDPNADVLLVVAGAELGKVKPPVVFAALPKLKFILKWARDLGTKNKLKTDS